MTTTTTTQEAKEITTLERTTDGLRPVFIQDIMQEYLRDVSGSLDCYVAGNMVRLYDGVRLNLIAGGTGTHFSRAKGGKIMYDLTVRCLDGQKRILPAGSEVEIEWPE